MNFSVFLILCPIKFCYVLPSLLFISVFSNFSSDLFFTSYLNNITKSVLFNIHIFVSFPHLSYWFLISSIVITEHTLYYFRAFKLISICFMVKDMVNPREWSLYTWGEYTFIFLFTGVFYSSVKSSRFIELFKSYISFTDILPRCSTNYRKWSIWSVLPLF